MAESIQGTKLESGLIGTTVADDINYRSLGESFSDAIKLGMTTADDRSTEITEAQDEIQKVWDENNQLASTNGDYLNTRVVKLAEEGSLQLQQLSQMYSKGEITRNKYLTQKNNVLNSAKQLTSFINTYQDMRNKGLEAAEVGSLNQATGLSKGAQLNVYNQDKLGAAAQLENHGFFLANDGKIFFQKYDQNGKASNNINDFKTMPGALSASIQEYQNVDLTKETASVAAVVKPFIKVIGSGKIKTREDAFKEPKVEAYINDSWEGLKSDSEKMMSIITMQGVKPPAGHSKWDFTENPQEAAQDPSKILIQVDPKSDRFVAVQPGDKAYIDKLLQSNYSQADIDAAMKNYEGGVAGAHEVFKNSVASQLGFKETYKAPTKSTETSEQTKMRGADKERYELAQRMKLFYSGTEGDVESVSDELKGTLIQGESGDKKKSYVEEITRDNDRVYIRKRIVTRNDEGKEIINYVTTDYDFGNKSEYDFTRGISALVYGSPMQEKDFSGLGRDSGKRIPYFEKDAEGNPTSTQRTFKSGSTFSSSATTPDYTELVDTYLTGMAIKPDAAIVSEINPDKLASIVNQVGVGFTEAITGKGIEFGGLTYTRLPDSEDEETEIGIDQITLDYQGKNYNIEVPIDYDWSNGLQAGKEAGVKNLLRSIYESMRENRAINPSELSSKTGLTVRVDNKKVKKLMTLTQFINAGLGKTPADYKAWKKTQ